MECMIRYLGILVDILYLLRQNFEPEFHIIWTFLFLTKRDQSYLELMITWLNCFFYTPYHLQLWFAM